MAPAGSAFGCATWNAMPSGGSLLGLVFHHPPQQIAQRTDRFVHVRTVVQHQAFGPRCHRDVAHLAARRQGRPDFFTNSFSTEWPRSPGRGLPLFAAAEGRQADQRAAKQRQRAGLRGGDSWQADCILDIPAKVAIAGTGCGQKTCRAQGAASVGIIGRIAAVAVAILELVEGDAGADCGDWRGETGVVVLGLQGCDVPVPGARPSGADRLLKANHKPTWVPTPWPTVVVAMTVPAALNRSTVSEFVRFATAPPFDGFP